MSKNEACAARNCGHRTRRSQCRRATAQHRTRGGARSFGRLRNDDGEEHAQDAELSINSLGIVLAIGNVFALGVAVSASQDVRIRHAAFGISLTVESLGKDAHGSEVVRPFLNAAQLMSEMLTVQGINRGAAPV